MTFTVILSVFRRSDSKAEYRDQNDMKYVIADVNGKNVTLLKSEEEDE